MEQNHPQPPGMLGGQLPPVPDPTHAAAIVTKDPVLDVAMQSSDANLQPAGAPPLPYRIERKRRTASTETLAQFEKADAMRELVLIFNTSKGNKGAYGGLGHETREAQEKTIDSIIEATVPGLHFEQKRIDQIDVYEDKPTFFIVLFASSTEVDKALGPQSEVHKTISYHVYGRTDTAELRSNVAIVVTTPDRVPNLKMFEDRTNKSQPAGGLLPGIPIMVYLQDTRQNILNIPAVLEWLTEDIMDDLKAVLTHELQPKQGFTIKLAPNQPSRLAPRNSTAGTTGLGISIKLYLIAPPPLDPRDIESVTGVLLPTPLLMPRCYTKTPGTADEYTAEWDYDPEDPDTQKLTRAERCCGGPRGMGDSVTVRYIAPTYSSGTLLATSTGERLWRIGSYDPEKDATDGLELQRVPKSGSAERRNNQRLKAAKLSKIIDTAALRAHKEAQATVYFSEVCTKAIERISQPNGSTYIPAEFAKQVAATLDPPAELLAAACHDAKCQTRMCISLLKISNAVVDARAEGRAEAANRITTQKIDAQLFSQVGPRPEPRAPHAASSSGGYHTVQKSSTAPRPPNPHYGADAPILRDPPGKGGGKGKGKGKGLAPTAGKGKGTPSHSVDRLRATDGTGIHGTVRPTTPPDERRYDEDGSGPYMKSQFYQHYKNLDQWNAAASRVEPRPRGRPTTLPPFETDPFAESAPKSARRTEHQHHSPGRAPVLETHTGLISQYGSNWTPAPPAVLPPALRHFHIPIVHGWNAPMPLEGDNPNNRWIEPAFGGMVQKLARGLPNLMRHSTKGLSEDRVLVNHDAIMAYMIDGHIYTAQNVEQLMEALEQANVVAVHTIPSTTYGGDEDYYYEFLIEPLVQMDAGASNEML